MKLNFTLAKVILVHYLISPIYADEASDAAAQAIVDYHTEIDAAAKVAADYENKSDADKEVYDLFS